MDRVSSASLAALIALLPVVAADPLPEDRGSTGLWQALRKLETNGRVLYVTAHPDDEDAGLLTMLARGRGYDVTLLSLTRGESGANLITGDTFDNLGVLRTLELEKATQYYGVKLRFAGFADYGYSKNVEEAWRKWNRDEVVAAVSAVIRDVKPHVVITRFSGTPRDGHGQHQASGIAGRLAFEATPGPSKLYQGATLDDFTIQLDSGQYEPMFGRSYAQLGREGYRWQRSQAMGAVLARPGPTYSYLKLTASRAGQPPAGAKEKDLFERLTGANIPSAVATHVATAKSAFRADDLVACAPHLAKALTAAPPQEEALRERIRHALNLALSVELESLVQPDVRPTGMAAQFRPWTTFTVATPGQQFRINAQLHVRSGATLENVTTAVTGVDWPVRKEDGEFVLEVPASATPQVVTWNRDSIQETKYRWANAAPRPRVRANYRYQGVESYLETEPETSSIDSIGLQVRRKLAIGPPLSVQFTASNGIVPVGVSAYPVEIVVRNTGKGARKGALRLDLPPGVVSSPLQSQFEFRNEGEESRVTFQLRLPASRTGDLRIRAVATLDGGVGQTAQYSASFSPITYSGLETLYVSKPAEHTIRAVDVKVAPGIRIGYVMGSGDEVPEALRQLGVAFDLLTASDIASAPLQRYSTILLGIRAYAARPELKIHNARLLEYVRNGGTLVVQYNTQEYDGNYGPYPYSMTARAEEISEEDSPVKILDPTNPVFQSPNQITAADFDGWVEQRGSKFWMTWAPDYKPLLETQDTGQTPQRGGWLEARHGKGLYVYCAYAWYRQLPYAVPGATRLFANLISLRAAETGARN
jgi:LmbE family N-acetylglucosaminyl deacetylase